jgi:hypothetical protein
LFDQSAKASRTCNLTHAASRVSASFSDPNLVASAGLVPLVHLAERFELAALIRRHVHLGTTPGRIRRARR